MVMLQQEASLVVMLQEVVKFNGGRIIMLQRWSL